MPKWYIFPYLGEKKVINTLYKVRAHKHESKNSQNGPIFGFVTFLILVYSVTGPTKRYRQHRQPTDNTDIAFLDSLGSHYMAPTHTDKP